MVISRSMATSSDYLWSSSKSSEEDEVEDILVQLNPRVTISLGDTRLTWTSSKCNLTYMYETKLQD